MKNNFIIGIAVLLLGVIACEPVFAIGWKEILFVIVLATFLLGPPIYRFLRRLENIRRRKDK
jgi:hypothetical protein